MDLKVYGGPGFRRGKQIRVLIVAGTKKRALALFQDRLSPGVTAGYFGAYFCVTANPREMQVLQHGEGVWAYPDMAVAKSSEPELVSSGDWQRR